MADNGSMEGDFGVMLDALDARLHGAEVVALGRGMEHIRSVATPLVPVETGQLVGSADVTVHEATGDGASTVAEIYFPGPYARYQHYGLDFRHTVGQALYLEQPMVTEGEKVLNIISDYLGSVF